MKTWKRCHNELFNYWEHVPTGRCFNSKEEGIAQLEQEKQDAREEIARQKSLSLDEFIAELLVKYPEATGEPDTLRRWKNRWQFIQKCNG